MTTFSWLAAMGCFALVGLGCSPWFLVAGGLNLIVAAGHSWLDTREEAEEDAEVEL